MSGCCMGYSARYCIELNECPCNPRSPAECATDGCEKPATVHFERGGVGSHYCLQCYMKVQALAAPHGTGEGR